MRFSSRKEAGHLLAKALQNLKGTDCVVYALPRGGVPVAAEIASSLNAPLDVILAQKIGVPGNPELAMGAVVDGSRPTTLINRKIMKAVGASEMDFHRICARELREIERRRDIYLGDKHSLDPEGRVCILVDDGIATGSTARVALEAMRTRLPKRLIFAVPVAAQIALSSLSEYADEIVCLEQPESFEAVGSYYEDFSQVSDAEVVGLLREARKNRPEAG